MNRPTISVVTVTLNCAQFLPRLVDSLLAQDDDDFDWVVVDGGSTDGTLDIAARFPPSRTTVISGPDFGIYDALNKAVAAVRSQYYLVVGADDRLHPTAITHFRKAAMDTNGDIIAASVESSTKLLRPMKGLRWLRGGNAFVASHAVGTMIRKDLHASCGRYSNRYVNCADMHFILLAVTKAGARVAVASFVAGVFGDAGASSVDRICSQSDVFRIQLAFGENKAVQLALLIGRLLRTLLFSHNPSR
jgi:glycosyltransferase involved in cell wall biosynthesis